MERTYSIRKAMESDINLLVRFTVREAREAEGLDASEFAARRGVSAAFGTIPLTEYWIAEWEGTPVGAISVAKEWSNFKGGFYWWVQSVFIETSFRGTGLLDQLLDHIFKTAREHRALDIRLYAHTSNGRAIRAYERCGFAKAPYVVMTKGVESNLD